MKKDNRKVFAIISDTEDIAGVHLAGSREVVPAIFADKKSAKHHMDHCKAYPYDIEEINMTVTPIAKPNKKKNAKRK